MPKHLETLIIGHRPDELFRLVSDIHAYPDFIKWVRGLRVKNEQVSGDEHRCDAEVVVGFRGFVERFSTAVVTNAAEKSVRADLLRGPFRRLVNTWKMEPYGEASSRVEFMIDYEFRNPILSALASTNTETAISKIMKSYMDEARRRYGEPSSV